MLTLQNISIAYQQNTVVHELSAVLKSGQIGCLLGPSGCGKTSTLRAIAGFEPLAAGHIVLREQTVSSVAQQVAPEQRRIGVVFQDFALFPHMTVTDNIRFGLKGLSDELQVQRTAEVLALVNLADFAQRFPYQLSGGQQQRVALARALAPRPELLLLDEPFSSLDAELREVLAADIRRIIKHEGTTALMVTHDQHEAFAMADVIGVMNDGRLQQWASAYDLYHRPANRFVAGFIGSGVMLKAEVNALGQVVTPLGILTPSNDVEWASGQGVEVLIRPDDIIHDDTSQNQAVVLAKSFQGAHILYQLQLHGLAHERVLCLAPSHHDHDVGEQIGIRLDLQHKVVFPVNG